MSHVLSLLALGQGDRDMSRSSVNKRLASHHFPKR
jgi:hypothetical protein